MKQRVMQCMLGLVLGVAGASALADDRFRIERFQVDGNSLLSTDQVQGLVAPFTGEQRDYGDVQKALEALENAYRKLGYTVVQVSVPEQELTAGIVRIQVSEGKIGKITVSGNKYFSEQNVRASLPVLQSGVTPNMNKISDAVQLSNENAAKQITVGLSSSPEADNTIDAEVKVTDYNPLRVILSLDNTGANATGISRTGVAIQDANLFGRDHVGTVAYTTSLDKPSGVTVDVYSLGYRIPFYALGDSMDFIYGKSNINTPATSATLGSSLGFTGKGDVYGLRWNHLFPRQGENSSRLVFGLDYKRIGSQCTTSDGARLDSVGACVPYTLLPLSVTYSAQKRGVGQNIDYNIGISQNIGTGNQYTTDAGRTDHYSFVTPGTRNTIDNFTVVRGGGSIFKALPQDWQMRFAGSVQYAPKPLVSAEQFGLVGASAVRGFSERAVAADSGAFINAELYTPELLGKKGNLRLLAFYDAGRGYNNHASGSTVSASMTVSSIGFGARYNFGRDFSVKLDVARVGTAGDSVSEKRGDVNAHVNAILGF